MKLSYLVLVLIPFALTSCSKTTPSVNSNTDTVFVYKQVDTVAVSYLPKSHTGNVQKIYVSVYSDSVHNTTIKNIWVGDFLCPLQGPDQYGKYINIPQDSINIRPDGSSYLTVETQYPNQWSIAVLWVSTSFQPLVIYTQSLQKGGPGTGQILYLPYFIPQNYWTIGLSDYGLFKTSANSVPPWISNPDLPKPIINEVKNTLGRVINN
jgi:hypothetical protein